MARETPGRPTFPARGNRVETARPRTVLWSLASCMRGYRTRVPALETSARGGRGQQPRRSAEDDAVCAARGDCRDAGRRERVNCNRSAERCEPSGRAAGTVAKGGPIGQLRVTLRYALRRPESCMKPLLTKNARRRFTVARDIHGVPHIEADSWRGALYGLGYMHAIDRPTQMLFSRAVASGQSTELIADKPELLEMDRFFRRAGSYLNLGSEVAQLDDETFDQLTAYCEGVNDGMKDAGRSLPMWATGFVPQPWNQRAVLLMGNLLSFGGLAVGQQQNERILLELIHAGVGDDKLRELFHPMLDDADFELLRKVKIASQLSDEALELITDLPRLAGSNAWAVSPRRSATGSALLASDPHLEVNRLPAIWYEAELHWGETARATTCWAPRCRAARCLPWPARSNVAWGVTYLKGDTSDYFIEDCRPGGATGWQYRRGDDWHDFAVRDERIVRKGDAAEIAARLLQRRGHARRRPASGASPAITCRRRGSAIMPGAGAVDRHLARHRVGRRRPPRRWTLPATARCPRCAGCLPTARGTSACRPAAGFRGAPRAQRPAADSGLGRAQSLARHAAHERAAARLRSARGLRRHGQRKHQCAGRPDAGHAAGARLSQAADRRAAERAEPGDARQTCRPCNTTW